MLQPMRILPLAFFAFLASSVVAATSRPNIVFILADDLGYTDSACFGSKYYEAPNIDRLAREGLKFTDGYTCGPNCAPTRPAPTFTWWGRLTSSTGNPVPCGPWTKPRICRWKKSRTRSLSSKPATRPRRPAIARFIRRKTSNCPRINPPAAARLLAPIPVGLRRRRRSTRRFRMRGNRDRRILN